MAAAPAAAAVAAARTRGIAATATTTPLAAARTSAPALPGAIAGSRALTSALRAEAPAQLGAYRRLFDGGLAADEPAEAPAEAAPSPISSDGRTAADLKPRVVFLMDMFQGPISDRLARYIDVLVEQKVQVVILTDRPESGEGSITEVALSKLKAKRENGVIVVANNGGKIFAYSSSRSQSRQPLVPNVDGFAPQALEAFQTLNASLAKKFKVAEPVATPYVDGKGKTAQTLTYVLSLPKELSEKVSPKSEKLRADLWLAQMNDGLKSAGVPYHFELMVDANGMSAVTHATPLRGSIGRIREALKATMNGHDFLGDHPEQTLIIADPTWWSSFHRQPEMKQVNFLGAKSSGQAEQQIGAMLGDLSLEQVYVDRYMVESYVRKQAQAKRAFEGGYSGGGLRASTDGQNMGPIHLWKAGVTSKVLELIGKELRDGSWRTVRPMTLNGIVAQLFRGKEVQAGSQLYMPFQGPAVLESRKNGKQLWSNYGPIGLDYVQRFVQNLMRQLMPHFPEDVRDFQNTIHRLGAEMTSRTTLFFRNLVTGRVYKMGVRVPLSRLELTPDGQIFYGHVPRTGKNVPEVDEFTAKMMALALLKQDGVERTKDGWSVNHLPLTKIRIYFHYYQIATYKDFTPAELEGVETQVTSYIEKMLADEEFLKEYRETMGDERNRVKKKVAPAKPARKPAARKPAARAAAASKPQRAPRPVAKKRKR